MAQIIDLETKLTSMLFRKHSYIYYKKDLGNYSLPFHNLEATSLYYNSLTRKFESVLIEGFVLSPLTKARLWEGERATMNLDRGPYKYSTLSTKVFY